MKLKRLSIALASAFCASALIGCEIGKGKDANVTISNMKINGIPTAYMETDTIEWNKLTVTATLSDKSQVTFANSEIEFDVESPTSEACKLVVYTSELHSQTSPLTEGEYTITAALKEKLSDKYPLGTIVVGKVVASKYKLRTYDKPNFVSVYETNTAETGKGAGNEGKFRKNDELYTVGTLNTFRFAPKAVFQSLENPAKFITSDNYEKNVSLKQVVGETKTEVLPGASTYQVVKGGIKFADDAKGKTYELSVSPTEFAKKNDGTDAVVTFKFKVEKGLNVYSAKELGALNLTHYTTEDFYDRETSFEEHYGYKDGAEHSNSSSKVFYNRTTGQYEYPRYTEIWTEFLRSSGTFTADELVAYQDIPAVFLHNNIDLTVDDIPSSYFIYEGESAYGRVGSLRDDAMIYVPIVHDYDVTVNGNYFTFNTDTIPLCNSTTSISGVDLFIFPEEYSGQVPPGHATVFKFCGLDAESDDAWYQSQEDTAHGHKGIIKNMNTLGNTSEVTVAQNEKIMEVTGLIFGKNSACGGVYENVNVRQYQIGLFPDCNVGQPYNDHPQTDRTFIRHSKVFDCSNSGICNYHNGGTLVEHSEFNRFGGAPILNAGSIDPERQGITSCGEDVELHNEVTLQEVYYTAVGLDGEMVGMLKGWQDFFAKIGNIFVKDNKIDLVALNMDGHDYIMSPNHSYYGNVYLNKGSDHELRGALTLNTDMAQMAVLPEWQLYEGVKQVAGAYAPVFKSELGEIFFTDNGQMGYGWELFALDSSYNIVPWQQQVQGEFLSVLLPAGNTTMNAIIRIGKVSA